MVEFSTWLACQVVARHAIYEVPLRATLECLVQSALRRRGSVHLQREYRRLRSTTLKKLLATTRCGAAMADGVATIPSIRPNGARSGLSDQLAQAVQSSSAGGKPRSLWRRNSLRKRLRFARNGGHHRNARRIGGSCLSDRGSFAGLYGHFLVVFFA